MQHQEFFLPIDGLKVHVKLDIPYIPEGQKIPLLILQHGLTGHMEETHIIQIAKTMTSHGFAVLRPELYGHGLSEGDFYDHTVLKWVNQLISVIDYAKGLDWAGNLYLAGHSQGGLATMLVGAMMQDCLKAILPLSPAIVIWDGARSGNMLGLSFDPENLPPFFTFGDPPRKVSADYLRVARLLPVEESIRVFEKPVLIVHGDADEAVPYSYAPWAQERYKNCLLATIPGDTHCYDHHLDMVCEAILSFLLDQEKGESLG